MPYSVYIVRLNRQEMTDRPPKRFRDQNEHIDWDYPLTDECNFYYVWQTAHSPDCQLEQHRHCHGANINFDCQCKTGNTITKNRSNSFVRQYGLFLQRRKYQKYNPIKTRKQALKIEAQIAQDLRDNGHCAYYN